MNIEEQGTIYIPTCHFAKVSLIPAETRNRLHIIKQICKICKIKEISKHILQYTCYTKGPTVAHRTL